VLRWKQLRLGGPSARHRKTTDFSPTRRRRLNGFNFSSSTNFTYVGRSGLALHYWGWQAELGMATRHMCFHNRPETSTWSPWGLQLLKTMDFRFKAAPTQLSASYGRGDQKSLPVFGQALKHIEWYKVQSWTCSPGYPEIHHAGSLAKCSCCSLVWV
jgi:hypothetical protein